MADYLGPGVTRVLDPSGYNFETVVWQQGRPPLDSELNALQQIEALRRSDLTERSIPSGWIGNANNPLSDYLTDPTWSNYFRLGAQRSNSQNPLWVSVNGWVFPVAGTRTGLLTTLNDTDYSNVIALDPPPQSSGDVRVDYVWLEVWKARIAPNPSTINKPNAAGIYRYGNVEGSFSPLTDNLQDSSIGFETTQRVQIQYRIRVNSGVLSLGQYPDGFDTTVRARGTAASDTTYTFTNQRANGDSGLWRAGDGGTNTLGTVDGYSYGIPICAVFRRNGSQWLGYPTQNLNGSINRNPTATDRTGAKTLGTIPTLASALTSSATSLTLVTATNIPLPTSPSTPLLIQIGSELIQYSTVSGNTLTGLTRGVNGTVQESHAAGSTIEILSGRPDGLFADQIAISDILDLRHIVSPNGFDYNAILTSNLDQTLRGQLKSNWKFSGSGTRGVEVTYQDAVQSTATPLGIQGLDAPDGFRMVWSDASVPQKVHAILQPFGSPYSGVGASATSSTAYSLQTNVLIIQQTTANGFSAGDIVKIPVSQLKGGLQSGNTDQIRWINDAVSGAIQLRFEGHTDPIDPSLYTVTPQYPYSDDDLIITFGGSFPTTTGTLTTPLILHITAHYLIGGGRGLSRKPTTIHSVQWGNMTADILTGTTAVPANNKLGNCAPVSSWSRAHPNQYRRSLPITAESYVEAGSKTAVLQPFRKIGIPQLITVDGTAANLTLTASTITQFTTVEGNATGLIVADTANCTVGDWISINSGAAQGYYEVVEIPNSTTLVVDRPVRIKPTVNQPCSHYGAKRVTTVSITANSNSISLTPTSIAIGNAVVIDTPNGKGRYTVIGITGSTAITLDRPIRGASGTVTIRVYAAQGVMPMGNRIGTSKWSTVDPLGLFCAQNFGTPAQASIYVTVPRHLVPTWGEVWSPVVNTDNANFSKGVNFMTLSRSGSSHTDADINYCSYIGNPSKTYSAFSTLNPTIPGPLTYNSAALISGHYYGGIRQFTDSRGLGRKGLELPPFYGIARLFGVYEANDYFTNGSPFDPSTRTVLTSGSGAVNLLRQSISNKPSFWIEIDDDQDSTFIINSELIDISRSPNAISVFESGNYVVEAQIFGFDRGTFAPDGEARLVLTRPGLSSGSSWSQVGGGAVDPLVRTNNVGKTVTGPIAVLPGPMSSNDQAFINYSRVPYQGDAWGSQMGFQDIPYRSGPISTGSAYNLISTNLNLTNLNRSSQKPLEILASCSFSTTLGTGRFVGPVETSKLNPSQVGYWDPAQFPPENLNSTRPNLMVSSFMGDEVDVGPDYLGATESLPLGAIWRDCDFRGQRFSTTSGSPMVIDSSVGAGQGVNSTSKLIEGKASTLQPYTSSVGMAGDLVVHQDGEVGDMTSTTKYKTSRGGAVWVGTGKRPGGPISAQTISSYSSNSHTNILNGRAYLVRNAPTAVGANEVSGGNELMMLIITYGTTIPQLSLSNGIVECGLDGTGEQFAAADLYRVMGHPLISGSSITFLPETISIQ